MAFLTEESTLPNISGVFGRRGLCISSTNLRQYNSFVSYEYSMAPRSIVRYVMGYWLLLPLAENTWEHF